MCAALSEVERQKRKPQIKEQQQDTVDCVDQTGTHLLKVNRGSDDTERRKNFALGLSD